MIREVHYLLGMTRHWFMVQQYIKKYKNVMMEITFINSMSLDVFFSR